MKIAGQWLSKGWSANRGSGAKRAGSDACGSGTSPEHALLIAIIDRAWSDALLFTEELRRGRDYPHAKHPAIVAVQREAKRDAIAWFLSEDRTPFSFRFIAETLNWGEIRIRALRARILEIEQRNSLVH